MAKEKVTVNVAGKERTVKFPVFSVIKLEKERGIKLSDLQDEEKARDLETIVGLVWAGLLHEDPSLTFEEVAMDIELDELGDIAKKVTSVLSEKKD